MKNTILTLIILQYGICYGQVTFQKTYGGWYVDGCYSLKQTSDSGFILTGFCYSGVAPSYNMYLVKTDFKGDLIWSKTFDESDSEGGMDVIQTADSGFVVAGCSNMLPFGISDVLLLKTNSNGDTLWCKSYGESGDDRAFCIQQTVDSGYIMTGYTNSFGTGVYDLYLIKTDNNGNLLWSKTIGGTYNHFGNYVEQTSDSGFIIAGGTVDSIAGYADVLLVKTDLNGDTLWTKSYGGIYDEAGNEVHQTSDGGYVVVGTTLSSGFGNPHVILLKTDMYGNLVWTKVFGGGNLDRGKSLKVTADGGYIISGHTTSFGNPHNDIYLIKTDVNGDTLWTRTIGDASTSYGYSLCLTYDGGYAIGGFTELAGAGGPDLYLLKTDSNGNSACLNKYPPTQQVPFTPVVSNRPLVVAAPNTIESIPSLLISQLDTTSTICTSIGIDEIDGPKTNILIYPNPFSDKINIHGTKSGEVMLYDLCGRQVLKQKAFSGVTILSTEIISPGIYLLHYYDNNTIVNFKLIKQ